MSLDQLLRILRRDLEAPAVCAPVLILPHGIHVLRCPVEHRPLQVVDRADLRRAEDAAHHRDVALPMALAHAQLEEPDVMPEQRGLLAHVVGNVSWKHLHQHLSFALSHRLHDELPAGGRQEQLAGLAVCGHALQGLCAVRQLAQHSLVADVASNSAKLREDVRADGLKPELLAAGCRRVLATARRDDVAAPVDAPSLPDEAERLGATEGCTRCSDQRVHAILLLMQRAEDQRHRGRDAPGGCGRTGPHKAGAHVPAPLAVHALLPRPRNVFAHVPVQALLRLPAVAARSLGDGAHAAGAAAARRALCRSLVQAVEVGLHVLQGVCQPLRLQLLPRHLHQQFLERPQAVLVIMSGNRLGTVLDLLHPVLLWARHYEGPAKLLGLFLVQAVLRRRDEEKQEDDILRVRLLRQPLPEVQQPQDVILRKFRHNLASYFILKLRLREAPLRETPLERAVLRRVIFRAHGGEEALHLGLVDGVVQRH
mmetsp:Transcript_113212/g.327054  ORF Transcript_113212/g.327054 Transcript_113212/m.327054 type:complete len:482 (+) Transcript_113212:453-1898(+)